MDSSEAFPEKLPEQFDAVIIHDPADIDRVLEFHKRVTELVGSDVRVTMFGCEEMIAGQLRFNALEDIVKRSTLMFLFMTKTFCQVRANVVLQSACLTKMVDSEDKRWCVIPIWTEPRDYSPSMIVSSLSGYPEQLQGKFRKDNFVRLFTEKSPLRKLREQEQLVQREQLGRAARDQLRMEEERKHKENLLWREEQHQEQMRSNERQAELEQQRFNHELEWALATGGNSPAALLLRANGGAANGTLLADSSRGHHVPVIASCASATEPYAGVCAMPPFDVTGAGFYPPMTGTTAGGAGCLPERRAALAGGAPAITVAAGAATQMPTQWPRQGAQLTQPAAAAAAAASPPRFVQAWPDSRSKGMLHQAQLMGANLPFAHSQHGWSTAPSAHAGAMSGCAYRPYPGAEAVWRPVDAGTAAAAATVQLHHSSSDGCLQPAAQQRLVFGPCYADAAEAVSGRVPAPDRGLLQHGTDAAAARDPNATAGHYHAQGSAAMQSDTPMKRLQRRQPGENLCEEWKPLHPGMATAERLDPSTHTEAKLPLSAGDLSAHCRIVENVGDRQQALLNDCKDSRIAPATAPGLPAAGEDGYSRQCRQGLPSILPQQEALVNPGGSEWVTGPQWVTATVGEGARSLIRADSRDACSYLTTFVRGMQPQDSASLGSCSNAGASLHLLPAVASGQRGQLSLAAAPHSHEQDGDLATGMQQMQLVEGFRAPVLARPGYAWPIHHQQMPLFAATAVGVVRDQAGTHVPQSHSVPDFFLELATARAAAQREQLDSQRRSTTSMEGGSRSILLEGQSISGAQETSWHFGGSPQLLQRLPSGGGSPQPGSSVLGGWSVCDQSLEQGATNNVGLTQPGQLFPSNVAAEQLLHGSLRQSVRLQGGDQPTATYDSYPVAQSNQDQSFEVLLNSHPSC